MGAYKRQDWNDLIADVNNVLQNPPEDTDCEPIEPIDEVGPDHIWTKTDISTVQDALKQTCPDITFDDIPDLWKQSIIDEINAAIEQAWCDCKGCDDTESESLLFETELRLWCSYWCGPCLKGGWMCPDDPVPPCPDDPCNPNTPSYILLCSLINGVKIGVKTDEPGSWSVYKRETYNGVTLPDTYVAQGIIDEDGIAHCSGGWQLSAVDFSGSVQKRWICRCLRDSGWPLWCCLEWEWTYSEVVSEGDLESRQYILKINQCVPRED